MLLVQDFLKTKSFQELIDFHGVYASFSKCGIFFSLNYDQIDSKEGDFLAQQCRGLILAHPEGKSFLPQATIINDKPNYRSIIPGETKIVALPFFRFFNQGQGSSAPIDWNDPNLKVYSKEDGTCIILWHDPFSSSWNIATRGTPQADININDIPDLTFSILFKNTLSSTYNVSFEDFVSNLDTNVTYVFELCSVFNRIVVDYQTPQIFLLGARNLATLQEYHLDEIPVLPVPKVKTYNLSKLDEIVTWVSSLNPLENEGVVVKDSQFNRIKVKNAAYLAYNRCHDSLSSTKSCLELILLEKDDDIIQAMPKHIVDRITTIKSGLKDLITKYDRIYKEVTFSIKDLPESEKRKGFALALNKHKVWQAPFFNIFSGKATDTKDFILKNKKDGTWADSFLSKILESM